MRPDCEASSRPGSAKSDERSAYCVAVDQARRCALLQRRAARRFGENDAWLVATAESIDADVVGADRIAFERLGARYLRYR
jgi:predicted nucleic acid-binding protein